MWYFFLDPPRKGVPRFDVRLEPIAILGCASFTDNATVKVLPGITAIIARWSAVDDMTPNIASGTPVCEEPEGAIKTLQRVEVTRY